MLMSPAFSQAAVVPAASPSWNDVSAAYALCADGDTLSIPAGSATWTSGLTITKRIRVQGQGSGRVVARSTDTVSVGTGTKTFVLLPVPTGSVPPIATGQVLRVERTGGAHSNAVPTGSRPSMTGTVISYTGGTLSLNVTSTTGGGTHPLWIVSTAAATTITQGNSGDLISVTEHTSGPIEIAGLRFVSGNGDKIIRINYAPSGRPCLIHDCYFEQITSATPIYANTNRGVVWNCSFPCSPFSTFWLAIHRPCDVLTTSWETAPTMGSADTTGENNFYIEDCDFHAYGICTDFDSNSRQVVRHCTFNNAGLGSHGADTSSYGQRHTEIYDCEMIFNGYSNGQTMNLNWWFFLRGGVLIMTDNVMPLLDSGDYSNKSGIDMTVMNLQRNEGPNPCWGAGIEGVQYPCPRQVGRGFIDGSAGSDSFTFKGELEPCYYWNNTGGYTVGISDYGDPACANSDSSASYIIAGRDYYNDGTPKPGYAKYTYPHPLRPATPATPPAQTKNLRVRPTEEP